MKNTATKAHLSKEDNMSNIPFPTKPPIEYSTSIHCRFSVATMKRLSEIAEATGQHMNRTVAVLVDTILPYVQISEVTEPHKVVKITLPDKEAMN